MKKILLITLTAVILPSLTTMAQTDIKAVKQALAMVIHNHREPQCGDTVAVRLSKKFSHSPEMQTAIASAYLQNQNREKAEMYLAKANAIEHNGVKGYAPAYIIQGDIYREYNNIDSAAIFYERAITVDPLNADSYVNYALMYASRGDTAEGVAMLERMRTAIPTFNVDATIADVYSLAQDQRGAATFFEKTNFDLLRKDQVLSYAISLYEQQRYNTAINMLTKAQAKFPDEKQVNRLMLWHCSAAQQYETAILNGKKYMENTPEDSIWSIDHFAMGTSYLLTNDVDAAFDSFTRCNTKEDAWKAVKKNIPSVFAVAANAMRDQKQYDEALSLQRRFLAWRGNEATARNYISLIQTLNAKLTDIDEDVRTIADAQPLIDECKKFERSYPKDENVDFVMFIHWRWLTVFDKEMNYVAMPEAQALYKYLDSYPDRDKGQDSRLIQVLKYIASYNYFKLNRPAIAKTLWKRILQIDPNDETAQKALGR